MKGIVKCFKNKRYQKLISKFELVLALWIWMDQIWMKNASVVMIILANFGVSEEKT